MRIRLGLGGAAASVFAAALVVPAMVGAASASTPHAGPAISQSYTCSTPIGDVSLGSTVTGTASIKGTKISLKSVKYTVTNTVGLDLTIDHIKVSTPDPARSRAKYIADSVTVAPKPPHWTAGHDSDGIFASFAGSKSVPAGDSVKVAALAAKYRATGASGTKVAFHPGLVTFHVSAPIAGDVTCTPDAPVGTFASVTE